MSELLLHLIAMNLLAAGAVVVVLILRLPARRIFGPRIAYGLWSLVPLAAGATLLPARVVTVTAGPEAAPEAAGFMFPVAATPAAAPADPWPVAAIVWGAGVLLSIGWLAWRQARFAHAAREGRAGPAVVGVLRPRVVTPSDFALRFTPREQRVVLAHEQSHIDSHDSRLNALVAVARCVNWFNPLVHLAARLMRFDQELACDARVVAAHPDARRAYAEAMLKAQLAARPLPLGCHWAGSAPHPLARRIALLARPAPSGAQLRLGAAMVTLLAMAAAGVAWAAKPARVMLAPQPPAAVARVAPPTMAAPVAVNAPEVTGPGPLIIRPLVAPPTEPPVPVEPAPPTGMDVQVVAPAEPVVEPPAVRKIFGAASRSWVQPGYAVRLVAHMVDPDGRPLVTDLTSYGSQRGFRVGSVLRNGSRYALYTSVVQEGDQLHVIASLGPSFRPHETGAVILSPGETGQIELPSGQVVTVTPTLRPETPQEQAAPDRSPRRIVLRLDRYREIGARMEALREAWGGSRDCEDEPGCPAGL